jgi:membrane-bound lytic murein transglycosylase A
MKKLLFSSGLLVLLAACSSVPLEEGAGTSTGAGAQADIASAPLVVPPLQSIRETPARALAGKFQQASWASLPGWQADSLDHVWKGFINNCKGLMRPVSGSLAMQARATPRAWQPVCAAALQSGIPVEGADAAQVRSFLENQLQPWRLLDAAGKPASNTVTGYYEPMVRASRSRGGVYQWPLYAAPDDLLTIDLGAVYPELAGKRVRGKLQGKRVVPYDTRAEIAASPSRQPPVIVWVDDPVEAFFLQIQGSGRALLPNGSTLRIAYADHNGRPYASIAKWLAEQGEMPLAQASMQNIKAWARSHPSRIQEMLNANPAMVFFKAEPVTDPELGPNGAYGIPLIGQRSIAVDTTFVPLGAPVFLASTYPGTGAPLRRLVLAQDTGAAIKGAGRTDFYWGTGDEAGAQAGKMKQSGQTWVLWPKGAGAPSAR